MICSGHSGKCVAISPVLTLVAWPFEQSCRHLDFCGEQLPITFQSHPLLAMLPFNKNWLNSQLALLSRKHLPLRSPLNLGQACMAHSMVVHCAGLLYCHPILWWSALDTCSTKLLLNHEWLSYYYSIVPHGTKLLYTVQQTQSKSFKTIKYGMISQYKWFDPDCWSKIDLMNLLSHPRHPYNFVTGKVWAV